MKFCLPQPTLKKGVNFKGRGEGGGYGRRRRIEGLWHTGENLIGYGAKWGIMAEILLLEVVLKTFVSNCGRNLVLNASWSKSILGHYKCPFFFFSLSFFLASSYPPSSPSFNSIASPELENLSFKKRFDETVWLLFELPIKRLASIYVFFCGEKKGVELRSDVRHFDQSGWSITSY